MSTVTLHKKTGIVWNLTQQLDDLDFVDDICLLSDMLKKVNNIVELAPTVGLEINIARLQT